MSASDDEAVPLTGRQDEQGDEDAAWGAAPSTATREYEAMYPLPVPGQQDGTPQPGSLSGSAAPRNVPGAPMGATAAAEPAPSPHPGAAAAAAPPAPTGPAMVWTISREARELRSLRQSTRMLAGGMMLYSLLMFLINDWLFFFAAFLTGVLGFSAANSPSRKVVRAWFYMLIVCAGLELVYTIWAIVVFESRAADVCDSEEVSPTQEERCRQILLTQLVFATLTWVFICGGCLRVAWTYLRFVSSHDTDALIQQQLTGPPVVWGTMPMQGPNFAPQAQYPPPQYALYPAGGAAPPGTFVAMPQPQQQQQQQQQHNTSPTVPHDNQV